MYKSSNVNLPSLFGKYRTELMGIAIIGVLISHTFGLGELSHSGFVAGFIYFLHRLAFTPGFLFLSGFGLYFSISKNRSVGSFYIRRLKRLVIPFVLMSAWYYIYMDLVEAHNTLRFIGHITTLAFWYQGNYNGMWYVAISVVLYASFPCLYKFMFQSNRGGGKSVLLIVSIILLNIALQFLLPAYYARISIGIDKIPIFILGVYVGYLSVFPSSRDEMVTIFSVFVVWCGSFFVKNNCSIAIAIYDMTEKLVYMSLICLLLYKTDSSRINRQIRSVFRWFGKYSLELYVLHLLIYCFISSNAFGELEPHVKVCIMISVAMLLCMPVHYLIDKVIKCFLVKI